MNPIIALLVSATVFSVSASATEYYVNPNGNDAWTGKLQQPDSTGTDGPFKTLAKAKQAIRLLKQANQFTESINVNIANGTYYLSQSLNFDLIDSGFPGKEIVWRGEPGGQVIISGGIPVTCAKQNSGLWECPLARLPATSDFFDTYRVKGNAPKFEFFVNNQKLSLARWPDKGWAHIKESSSTKTQFSVLQTLPAFVGDIKNAQIHAFAGNDWFDQILGIASIDKNSNTINLTSPVQYNIEAGRRFYIQNIQSALDAPGEWFYDVTRKKVIFIPQTGSVPQHYIVSSLPNLISAEGANYISFKNMSFEHGTATAITIKNSNNLKLDHVNVNNVGGIGISVMNSSNIDITNSEIHHTGADAIKVSGGDRKTLQPSGYKIHNNHLHHFGTTIMTFPGISATGAGIQITHNLVEEGPGTGIWLSGNDNLVEKNELYHLCSQASDCGAFYSGRDWSFRGNQVKNNYIHDIIGYSLKNVDLASKTAIYITTYGTRGIYLDDAVSGFEVSGNILSNAGSYGIQIGGGRDNKIHDNYINTSQNAIYIDDRWDSFNWDTLQSNLNTMPYKGSIWSNKYPELTAPMHNYKWPEGNRIERNIIVTDNSNDRTLYYIIPADSTTISENVIWNSTGKSVFMRYKILESQVKVDTNWTNWLNENIEKGSVSADPCATLNNKKLTFCASSSAKTIGFASMPTDIGLLP